MNKLFKVIWSKSKQCYIVVSEVAKNTTGKKKIVVASVLAALTVSAQVSTVEAAIQEGSTSNNAVLALVNGATASGTGAVAIGDKASASTTNALAVGTSTSSTGDGSVAVGSGSKATGASAVAVGAGAYAKEHGAVALGNNVNVETNKAVGVGFAVTVRQAGATNIGYYSTVNTNQALSVGARNDVDGAAQYGTAVGYFVKVTGKNGVAIGSSNDNNGNSDTGRTLASADSAVAIGTSAHAEAAHSIGLGTRAKATAASSMALGTSSSASGVQSIAIGSAEKAAEAPNASGTQSIAIGTKTVANSGNAIAMGSTATASGVAATAIGAEVLAKQHGSTAIGNQVKVEGNKSVGLGFQVSSKQDGTTAIGYITNVLGNQSVGIGSNMTVGENAGGAVAIGYMSSVTGQSGIGIGSNGTSASADSTIALGNTSKASGTSAIAIGKNSNAALAHSVALGEGSTTAEADGNATNGYLTNDAVNNTGNGVVSVGNGGSILRRITSVASGTNDNDAINVKQLKALRNASISTVSVVNGATTTDLVPSTTEGDTDANKVKLVAGKNITLTANGNSVTIASKSEVTSITSGNSDAISVSTGTDGKVSVTPNLAANVNATGDANKLVTAGKVKEALADKVSNDTLTTELAKKANATDVTNLTTNKLDKTAELHVKKGTYSVATDGSVTLDKADGTGTTKSDEAVKITGVASKAKLDELKTTVDAKADKSYVDTELGKKVSTTDMNAALADKVSTAKLTEELNKKANASDITNLTADKVSKADELHVKKGTFAVNTEGKVTLKKVNGTGAEAAGEDVVIEGLASKSEINTINTELAKKVSNDTFTAEKNRVNGELANKLDTATFETAKATLATHDDINALKEVVANKLDKDTANAFVEGMKNKVSTEVLNKKLEDADKANSEKIKAAKEELSNAITTATADKVSKADELHVVADSYEVDQAAGTVTLRQENGLNDPKPEKNFTITGIATKQDVTNLINTISTKADKSYVDTELGKKANAADVATELGKKADQSALTALEGKVNAKADASALTTMGENKLDKSSELHVKTTATPYTVDAAGKVTLKQENGEGTEAADKDIVIEGIASTAKLEEVKDQLKGEIKTNSDKLGELDTKVNEKFKEVKDLADANKEKVDSLKQSFDARVTSVDNTLADHNTRLEDAKNKIDGINQNLTNNYATNDVVNKKLDNLKTELGTKTVLHFAGDKTIDEHSTPDNPADDDNTASKLSLNLKDQTLKVKGTTGEIETTAKGDTITLALSKAVKDDLAKVAQLGDTSADGRDGANGTAKDTGLTAKDGLNGKTLTEKVNAIRNGEAGSVVYTDDQGNRLTKANDGKYYLADDVGEDGNKKGTAQPVEADKLQVNAMNPLDPTKGVKMSNLADGKIAANSKDAVTGNQVYNTTNSIATALGGGASVNADGTLSEPTYNLKDKNGNAVTKHNVGDALATINDRFDSISSATNVEVDKLKDLSNISDKGKEEIRKLAGQGVDVKGDKNITVTSTMENGVKTFHATLSDELKLGGPDDTHPNVKVNGVDSTITAGNPEGNTFVKIDGKDGSITANTGNFGAPVDAEGNLTKEGTATSMDKDKGFSVTSKDKDGNVSTVGINNGRISAGDPVGQDGIPTNAGSATSMDKDGFSVATKDKDGKVSKVDIKNGGITAGASVDANGIPTEKNATAVSMGKDGFSVISTDENGKALTPITIKNGKISGLQPGTKDDDVATVGQVKEAIGKTAEVLEKTSQRVDQVGAHSAALAALNPLSYDPLRKSQIMAGVGTYAGNQSLALGIAHYANENFMVTAGFTMGAGKSMANLGATYRFGTGEEDTIPERYKGGPISSVYVMQDEITALKAENARKDAENAEMKAQIKMLMERMGLA